MIGRIIMIDLHLHLDGSLSESDFKYLSKINNVDLGSDFPNNIYVPMDCNSLEEYLERFDLPLKLLQNSESIEYATYSLVKRLYDIGVFYAEIRFAPLLHLKKGMTQIEVVKSALCGLKKAIKDCDYKIDANLILWEDSLIYYETSTQMSCLEKRGIKINETYLTADRIELNFEMEDFSEKREILCSFETST